MRAICLGVLLLLLVSQAGAVFERGAKSDIDEMILVGGQDWHAVVASVPLSTWSEENTTVVRPMLILPREVKTGRRLGWVEGTDLERYSMDAILQSMISGNVSAMVIHGSGEDVKTLVKTAQKQGMKVYMTVSLEPESDGGRWTSAPLINANDSTLAGMIRDAFSGLELRKSLEEGNDTEIDGYSLDANGNRGSLLCPVNPNVREDLYARIEEIVDEYKVDGVVLYRFGFEGEDYCFCDVCKEEFYRDTGLDLTRIKSSGYNYQKWLSWREQKVLEIAQEARNITRNLGPVELGIAIDEPFDKSKGYNLHDLAGTSDFVIISSVPVQDAELAARVSDTPVYVRLSDDYVEYMLSTQNVEGALNYIESLIRSGCGGILFEHNVVYTPLWSELEPPSKAAQWLIKALGMRTLGIGDVSWACNDTIRYNNSEELAVLVSSRWRYSPGAVLVGENYTAGIQAATVASYLNWPVLFFSSNISNTTLSEIERLGCTDVIITGDAPSDVVRSLEEMNLTVHRYDLDLLLREMRARNDSARFIVLTNSHDISLIPPKPESKIKRAIVKDLWITVETTPASIPSEEAGEVVRMNITLRNTGTEPLKGVSLVDMFASGRYVRMPIYYKGKLSITDPISKEPSDPAGAFFNGSILTWDLEKIDPDESVSLNLEVVVLHPMDAGWVQPLDRGITVRYTGVEDNVTVKTENDGPVSEITYPGEMPVGTAIVTWNVTEPHSYTALRLYSPHGLIGYVRFSARSNGYRVALPMPEPGSWLFNIEVGGGTEYRTKNMTIEVRSTLPPNNVTAFSHTKVPKLSLASIQVAAAKRAIVMDVAKDPQYVDPGDVEEWLRESVEGMDLRPEYLLVVGDPGSLPFPTTGLKQGFEGDPFSYDIYRDYRIEMDDDNYTEVATGRFIGLSVYDVSQMVARTLSYDRLQGNWKNTSLVVATPVEWPWSPVPIRIKEYLADAGLNSRDLRWEEATFQRVSAFMNNGVGIVHFDHHGSEKGWALSSWVMTDSFLDETQVKQFVLAPQLTTSNSCLSSRLKGFSINVSGTEMYIPMRLDDSIALAFVRAGAVGYVGSSALVWIYVSEDYNKRFYQALVFENATAGEALSRAENLYIMKMKGAEKISFDRIEEMLPPWEYSMKEMMNQTASSFMLFGDPEFRPYLPKTPELPYRVEEVEGNDTVAVSVSPISEQATDWLYWFGVDSTDGEISLNAPPAIIAEVLLPRDAEDVVVKEGSRVVWHAEDVSGEHKRVMWPLINPRLGDTRSFSVEYRIVPEEVQIINITAGWNAISIYVKPKDPRVEKYIKGKPYRGIFTVTDDAWSYSLKDSVITNITTLEPGMGYIIDSYDDFTMKISGKPVERPYRLKLRPGWNLVGLPVNESLAPMNITVNTEHRRYSFSEAVEKGLISAFMWKYEDDDWKPLKMDEPMEPGRAYLMEVTKECRLEFR